MNRFSFRLTFVSLALLASAGLAQQAPDTTPAADAPEAQQKPEKAKKPAPKKIYTNGDLASPDAKLGPVKKDGPVKPVADGDEVKADLSSAPAAQTANSCEQKNPPASNIPRLSVLDAPKETSPDVIVVPAGTQIRVELSEENPPRNAPLHVFSGKITVPVRVGWTTAIPALTTVAVEVDALYYTGPGPYYNADYQKFAHLTSVTLDDTLYELQTDQVPIDTGSEATFTLLNDLTLNQ